MPSGNVAAEEICRERGSRGMKRRGIVGKSLCGGGMESMMMVRWIRSEARGGALPASVRERGEGRIGWLEEGKDEG